MKKLKDNPQQRNAGDLSSEKTNQDFNKKKPDLNDPNEKKAIPAIKSRQMEKDKGRSGHGK